MTIDVIYSKLDEVRFLIETMKDTREVIEKHNKGKINYERMQKLDNCLEEIKTELIKVQDDCKLLSEGINYSEKR